MLSRLRRTSNILMVFSFVSMIVAGSALGQIAGGLNETTRTGFGGKNFIAGTVFSPSGRPVNSRIRIRLASMTAGEVITTTDDTGRFVFSGLSNGTYSVTVDSEMDYEAVTQQVEVFQSRGDLPQTFTLSIRLRAKASADLKPAIVRAENAGVPKRALDLHAKALELSKTGDHKGAIEQLKLAIAEHPEFMLAFTEMGVQYLKLNDLQKADESFLSALKLKPDAFEPLVNRGIVLFRLKRHPDAEAVLRNALKIREQSAIGHYYLGRTLANLNRYDEAEKEFISAIAIGGNEMKEAHRMLGSMYLEKGDDKRAVAELEAYLALAPNAPDADHLRTVVAQLKGSDSPAPKP